jgi:Class III cytochrome C family
MPEFKRVDSPSAELPMPGGRVAPFAIQRSGPPRPPVRSSQRVLLRLSIALAIVVCAGGCTGSHQSDVVAVGAADCAVCHTAEFVAATEPPHKDVLPTECALCHTDDAWEPAIFAHESVANRECVLCHRADYDGTTDPVHSGMFPTTCDDCHGTNAWQPALEGAHPDERFPISHGAHEGFSCTSCHNLDRGASTGGMNTDCVGCHTGEHRMSRVNEQHREVRDYNFDPDMPNFCLVCHPNGRQ